MILIFKTMEIRKEFIDSVPNDEELGRIIRKVRWENMEEHNHLCEIKYNYEKGMPYYELVHEYGREDVDKALEL